MSLKPVVRPGAQSGSFSGALQSSVSQTPVYCCGAIRRQLRKRRGHATTAAALRSSSEATQTRGHAPSYEPSPQRDGLACHNPTSCCSPLLHEWWNRVRKSVRPQSGWSLRRCEPREQGARGGRAGVTGRARRGRGRGRPGVDPPARSGLGGATLQARLAGSETSWLALS